MVYSQKAVSQVPLNVYGTDVLSTDEIRTLRMLFANILEFTQLPLASQYFINLCRISDVQYFFDRNTVFFAIIASVVAFSFFISGRNIVPVVNTRIIYDHSSGRTNTFGDFANAIFSARLVCFPWFFAHRRYPDVTRVLRLGIRTPVTYFGGISVETKTSYSKFLPV